MSKREVFDAAIIGAGQAGVPLAIDMAKAGKRTLLIEKDLVGGTCLNYGCTPSKTLIATAKVADLIKNAKQYGLRPGDPLIDLPKVMERKDKLVKASRTHELSALKEQENLELVKGEASFIDNLTLQIRSEVNGETQIKEVGAEHVFINVGARPKQVDLPGLSEVTYYNTGDILELEELPKHLIIVGGGFTGLEMAQLFKRLGSEVTLLEQRPALLPNEDKDVQDTITQMLEDAGISLFTGVDISQLSREENGEIAVDFVVNDTSHSTKASHLLLAVGRRPNSDLLQLENTHVSTDQHGYIHVNELMETETHGIYAMGDVVGGAYTHAAFKHYRIISDHLLEGSQRDLKGVAIPSVLYTDPQFAKIGKSQKDMEEARQPYILAKMPLKKVAKAVESNNFFGFYKAIIDPETDEILGAAVIAEGAGEILSVLQTAMSAGITASRLARIPFAHPTYSEGLGKLLSGSYLSEKKP